MTFFSGFSLRGEEGFFEAYLKPSEYAVAGFSYGAVLAAEHAAASKRRIDLLQLFSPAFFQSRPEKFRRLQTLGYKKDPDAYLAAFRRSCFEPYGPMPVSDAPTSAQELEALLYYVWEPHLLHQIARRGTRIEVYLGSGDAVTDHEAARAFFTPLATVYTVRGANHFLQEH